MFNRQMKRLVLVAAAALLVAQQAAAGPWLNSLVAAQKKAKEKNQLIFVDLFAEWCGWCHRFEQEVIPSQAFQQATDKMVLLRLNTEDGAEGTKLARDLGITSLPTFLLLTNDTMIAGTLRGYAPAPDFARLLADAEQKFVEFKKRMASEESISKEYPKRLELARDIRSRYGLALAEARFRKLSDEPGVPVNIRDEAWYELAVTQMIAKRFDDSRNSINAFGKVQNKGEFYEKSRLLIGDTYLQQGNYASAVNEYKKFKSTFPSSPYVKNIDNLLPQIERQIQIASPTGKK
jgi:thioredoxin-related protein